MTTMNQPAQARKPITSVIIALTCMFAMIVNTANNTTVSIALPTMGRELQIPNNQLQWLVSSYPLSSGCLLLVFGRLADTHGRKRVFLLGSVWSAVFTLACAFAQNAITLDVLRGIQGIGAAATIPAALGILAHSFPPSRERSLAFSCFSAGGPIGAALGMILGGVLTELTSQTWRSVFYLATGLTVICIIGGLCSFDADVIDPHMDKRIDWIGFVLVTAGLVLLVFVLGQGEIAPQKWATPYIIALLILSFILLGLFFLWEYRLESAQHDEKEMNKVFKPSAWNPPPLMKVSLWKRANGRLAVMMCIVFLTWASFITWNFWVQLYFQQYLQLTPLETVVRILPTFISGLICNIFVAILIGKIPFIYLVATGTLATSIACLLFALIDPSAPYWAFTFPAAVISVMGVDLVFGSGAIFIAKVALPDEQSLAGGLFQTMTQIGTAFGVTITTVVFNRVNVHEMAKSNTTLVPLISYQTAQWTCFAFGVAALLLALTSFRGVGIVGHEKRSDIANTTTTVVDTEKSMMQDRENQVAMTMTTATTKTKMAMVVTTLPTMTKMQQCQDAHGEDEDEDGYEEEKIPITPPLRF